MNQKFLMLPDEKRARMLNAGYRVFSRYPYAKAPMAEIAGAADISKALLFHYFRNKQALYLFLWNHAIDTISQTLRRYRTAQAEDLFEMLRRSLLAKCDIMEKYPDMNTFTLRAYDERNPAVFPQIQADFTRLTRESMHLALSAAKKTSLRAEIDASLLYREILWASEGYMRDATLAGTPDPKIIRRDFERLIAMWRTAYTCSAASSERLP